MKFLILRRRHLLKKSKAEKIVLNDIEVQILYVLRVSKKTRQMFKDFDRVLSLDFKEFAKKCNLMRCFAEKSYEKILSRHGGRDKDVLEAQVDVLNEENAEILVSLALKARRVLIHSHLEAEEFDFLCEEAGVCPELVRGDFRCDTVVYLGEEFLIRHNGAKITYYDVVPYLPKELEEYLIPEENMIFSEYIMANQSKMQNVKIREFMSK